MYVFLKLLFTSCLFKCSEADVCLCVLGLAEVMAALGVEKLDKLMPDVVQTASKLDIASHVRDGYIMMFIYLPLTFGEKFTPYVGPIIPCILKVRRCITVCFSTALLHYDNSYVCKLSVCQYPSQSSNHCFNMS